ncbi:transposable element Tcb1 transposase [Trichonephila clavipes]|uniref:Transposable element Tcb1 transposase n=1 Tax=Trichonephila clavipes TaxID=2585209 RepID=A0A8X6VU40_TRICX|nr:transposable element Tcb1 transposase [Trichonephila clavipes]
MRLCHHWIQEETTERQGQSHSPRCTTAHEDRRVVCMASDGSRSPIINHISQQIHSVTNPSGSTRTIQRCLQQNGMSAKRPLLGLPLNGNHRRLRRQWCDEWRIWTTEYRNVVFTDESRLCLQHLF